MLPLLLLLLFRQCRNDFAHDWILLVFLLFAKDRWLLVMNLRLEEGQLKSGACMGLIFIEFDG